MLIFVIALSFIGLAYVLSYFDNISDRWIFTEGPGWAFSVGVITLILATVMLVASLPGRSANKIKAQEQHALIQARIDSGVCAPDRCVLDEIAEFNADYKRVKIYNESLWSNWFFSDIYEGLAPFDYIDFDHTSHFQWRENK